MIDFAFSPNKFSLEPGSEIRVTSKDKVPHTMTARNGTFDTGRSAPGESAVFKVRVGAMGNAIGFFCWFHGDMRGRMTLA